MTGWIVPSSLDAAYDNMSKLHSADLTILSAKDQGYYVISGCNISTGTTSGTVKCNAGTIFIGGTELNVSAQDNLPCVEVTTGHADASHPRWIGYEIDSSGVCSPVVGSAPSTDDPEPTTPTTGNVAIAAVYALPAVHTVNTSILNNDGNSKIIDKRMIVQPRARSFTYDNSATSLANPTAYTRLIGSAVTIPANSLNTGDTFEVQGTFLSINGVTTTTINMQIIFAGLTMTLTSASLAAATRVGYFQGHIVMSAVGGTARINSGFTLSLTGDNPIEAGFAAVAGTFDSTNPQTLDVTAKWGASAAGSHINLLNFSIVKVPAIP